MFALLRHRPAAGGGLSPHAPAIPPRELVFEKVKNIMWNINALQLMF
jgi:hypothetical protein